VLRPLVGTWFQVHYPPLKRGSSHLSIALLSSLSVVREYLALRDGPADSIGVSRDPIYLGTLGETTLLSRTGLSPLCGRPFHAVLFASGLVTPM